MAMTTPTQPSEAAEKPDPRYREAMDWLAALQRAIECHCAGKEIPADLAKQCPYHAAMLNRRLAAILSAK